MSGLYNNTPLLYSVPLSAIVQSDVYLKMEAMQPSGSFKNRGMARLFQELISQGAYSFICSSGGNAGLAAAYTGKMLGVRVKVIVPNTTPKMMLEKIKAEKADVLVYGENWNEADALARQMVREEGLTYVPPFDHPLIWAGNSTLIKEVAETGLKPDVVILSVGGGGLLCGVAQGMHEVGWQDVPIIAVETEGAASFAASIKADQLVTIEKIETIATSLGAKRVAEQAFLWSKKHPIYSQTVTDHSAVQACLKFVNDQRVLVEPSCGATLSLLYDQNEDLKRYKKILVVVCGGSSVDLSLLHKWNEKSAK